MQQFQKKKLFSGRGRLRPTLPAGLQWPSQKLQVGYAGSPEAGGRQNSSRRGALWVLSVLQRCRRGPEEHRWRSSRARQGSFPLHQAQGPAMLSPASSNPCASYRQQGQQGRTGRKYIHTMWINETHTWYETGWFQ